MQLMGLGLYIVILLAIVFIGHSTSRAFISTAARPRKRLDRSANEPQHEYDVGKLQKRLELYVDRTS